jgi:hypothetical protein
MQSKILITVVITLLLNINTFGQELLPSSKEFGLISYLTTVKSVAEFKMITLASDPQYKTEKEKAKSFQAEYNLLKLATDRFLNQLIADMTVKNRLKEYKKVNGFIKGDLTSLPPKMKAYEKSLEEIEGRLETFMLKTYSSMLAGPTIEEIVGAVELTHGIITDARDFREKKVANLSGQLKELKLMPLKELTEEKKK